MCVILLFFLFNSIIIICYTDINECELKDIYPCYGDCKNTVGRYNCTCPSGTEGDAHKKDGCRRKDNFTLTLKIVTGTYIL
jgi:hypothetical protein